MRRSAIGAIVGGSVAVAALGAWWLVDLAPWDPVQDGTLKASIDTYRGQEFAVPPLPQSGLTSAELTQNQADSANFLTPAEVAELWAPVQSTAVKDKWQAWGMVIDAESGEELLSANADAPHSPASTAKILTGLVALEQLDIFDTLDTGTSLAGDRLYLWGQGDLLLGQSAGNPATVNGRAGLADLAKKTAEKLRAQGIQTVGLTYQNQMFDGEKRLPAWAAQEVSDFAGDVAPFALDTGKTSPGAWDYVDDSALEVAEAFAAQLREQGITISAVAAGATPTDVVAVATVESAPIDQQLRYMLLTSDNTMAEQFCHLAAASQGAETSFAGSAGNVVAGLGTLGIDTEGMKLEDCSGLSENSQVSARQLVNALQGSVAEGAPSHALIRLLPRGGLNGTLEDRLYGDATLGNVQAKTGSLGKASTLAGVLTTASGQTLIFAVGSDNVPDAGAYWTRGNIDTFIEELAAR